MAERATNTGIVYILSNAAMPGYLKVGHTSGNSSQDVQRRMRELYNHTGVPRTFDCEYAAVVENSEEVEQAILKALGDLRVNPKREFLEGIDPVRVRAILELRAIKEVTPGAIDTEANHEADIERPPRAERFSFSMLKIPTDATLVWTEDPQKTCRVLNQKNRVEYEGSEYSLSNLSAQLKGYKSARGPQYWFYEGETLQERRNRFEDEEYDEA